jgi:uncharacterized protein
MTEFTPIASALGGALIGLAAVILMAANGRIAGVAGIAGRLLPPYADSETASRVAFIAGLILAPLLYVALTGKAIVQSVSGNLPLMIAAGLLVGFGATLGSGCTSGHGVCGLSRFSVRSLAAVATFMVTGFLTVFVLRHVLGGSP